MADTAGTRMWGGRWEWMRFPIGLFLCSRAALFGFSWIARTLTPALYTPLGRDALLHAYPWADGLYRWDSQWFFRVAERGYEEPLTTNFFPLLPLLARAVQLVTGLDLRLALLLVANVASFAAYLVVYRVYLHLSTDATARWALVLLATFPFAFFHAAAYPESLMMLCSALAVWLALRGQHGWAGVALGVGVLARHLTMLAGAALLTAQVRERGIRPRRFLLHPAVVGLVIPWVFLGAYGVYQYGAFGDALAFYHARSDPLWGERAWWGLPQWLASPERDVQWYVMGSYLPFALLPTIGAIMLVRPQWAELAAFAIVFLLVMWTVGLWGLGRYAASCWPAFLPLGAWLARRPLLHGAAIGVLALFQGLYFYLFTQQFPIF